MDKQLRRLSLPVPTRVFVGKNAVDQLGDIISERGGTVTIVTGQGSARKSGIFQRTKAALEDCGFQIHEFEGVGGNPSWSTCILGRDHILGTKTSLVVGLGGGSALDAAKAMALAATNEGSLSELISNRERLNGPIPMMAIPTTAGTGSEVTQYCIITDEVNRDKLNLYTNRSFPEAAVLDPGCTFSMPRDIAVGSGIDALCHAIEGYLSRRATPESSRLALESIKIIGDNLEPSVEKPGNDFLAEQMLTAAAMAGAVISITGTISLHALGYRLTLDHGVHHGLANALLLPSFLSVTEKYVPQKIQEILSALFGKGATTADLRIFLKKLGVEATIRRFGVTSSEFDFITGYVLKKKNVQWMPFNVQATDILEILAQASRSLSDLR